ncbi:NAD(P)H-dependent flavin oxidoreductase [Planococcus ruber]|uniref:NAD(P)H-dependent flavin oxidoreductase n=1 Tax=Planococcus ruber TaxID=2027871 RepID=UPI001FED7BC8|nr:nitronate monooxygenase family protein [Planococcus ruber]MCJ1909552.1 nitronate monooxygenase family protein [Planococcus ruber]
MLTWKTDICKLFNIRYPIIQAGMAGGPTTAELVAAVCEAGGLGTLGAAYLTPEDLRKAIRQIKERTSQPFAVNIFSESSEDDYSRLAEVQQALNPFRKELGIEEIPAAYASPNWSRQQFDICLELQVPIISTAFGCLPTEQTIMAKEQGIRLIAMATTVREAIEAEQAGVDAIVAQGSEAGGHRGTFSLEEHPMGALVGTISLVPQIVDAVKVPVIAAGGIADGRGLIASLALGAKGVQMGTRFLLAAESGASSSHKQAVAESTEESTVITKSFSGRPARGLRNRFITEFEEAGIAPLTFPSQNTVTKDIRAAAAQQGNSEFMSLWAGQTTRMLEDGQSAKEIIDSIMKQAEALCKTE